MRFIIVFAVMVIFGQIYGQWLRRKQFGKLADEVSDAGEFLVVRFGRDQESIALSNIINVEGWGRQPVIVLMLREPCRFGKKISFLARRRFGVRFSGGTVISELIDRTNAAQQR